MSDNEGLPPPRRRDASPARSTASRKRSRASDLASDSSDGMFFSSDNLSDAGLEHYASPRRKKHVKRTCYQSDREGEQFDYSAYRHEEKKRTKDSGVFMASDYSSSEDGFLLDPPSSPPHSNQIDSGHRPGHASRFHATSAAFTNNFLSRPPIRAVRDDERIVRQAVDACLEQGTETIDLSNANLESVSQVALEGLKQLVRHPRGAGSFQSLKPELNVYLYGNRLRALPRTLCELEHLTVLSVRGNKLCSLPASVGNLHNLTDLNLSSNKLRWLPFELLGLVKDGCLNADKLLVAGNPLVQPFAAMADPIQPSTTRFSTIDELEVVIGAFQGQQVERAADEMLKEWTLKIMQDLLRLWRSVLPGSDMSNAMRAGQVSHRTPSSRLPKQRPIFLGATAMSFFSTDGRAIPASSEAASQTGPEVTIIPIAQQQPRCPSSTIDRVPSLYEYSLRLYTSAINVEETIHYLQGKLQEDVHRVTRQISNGHCDRVCSTCGHGFLIPRAEWIEYWYMPADGPHVPSADEAAMPFLRQVCSWACAIPTRDV